MLLLLLSYALHISFLICLLASRIGQSIVILCPGTPSREKERGLAILTLLALLVLGLVPAVLVPQVSLEPPRPPVPAAHTHASDSIRRRIELTRSSRPTE